VEVGFGGVLGVRGWGLRVPELGFAEGDVGFPDVEGGCSLLQALLRQLRCVRWGRHAVGWGKRCFEDFGLERHVG